MKHLENRISELEKLSLKKSFIENLVIIRNVITLDKNRNQVLTEISRRKIKV